MKSIIAISIFLILLAVQIPAANGWEQGQRWGYLWERKWSGESYSSEGVANFSGTVRGEYVHALLIEHAGKGGEGDIFRFHGSIYTYGTVKGKVKYGENSPFGEGGHTDVDIVIRSLWVNYDGYFVLVEERDEGYYGIENLSFHVWSVEPLDIHSKIRWKGNNLTGYGEREFRLRGNFEMNARIYFSNPVPYLPEGDGSDIAGTSANYEMHGNVSERIEGYYSENSESIQGKIEKNVSLDRVVENPLFDTGQITVTLSRDGSRISKIGFPENVPFAALNFILGEKWSMANPMGFVDGIFRGDKARIGAGYFYFEISTTYALLVPTWAFPPINQGTSQVADHEDVEEVERNAPAVYGSYSEGEGENLTPIIIATACLVTISLAAILLIRRKNYKKHPP